MSAARRVIFSRGRPGHENIDTGDSTTRNMYASSMQGRAGEYEMTRARDPATTTKTAIITQP